MLAFFLQEKMVSLRIDIDPEQIHNKRNEITGET